MTYCCSMVGRGDRQFRVPGRENVDFQCQGRLLICSFFHPDDYLLSHRYVLDIMLYVGSLVTKTKCVSAPGELNPSRTEMQLTYSEISL